MLSTSQFEGLLRTYGAQPERWPEPLREDARALLASSSEARRLCEEALQLDQQMDAALLLERPSPSQQEAAVARLRMNLAARLAPRPAAAAPSRPRMPWAVLLDRMSEWTSPRLQAAGLMAGVCLAIAAGLFAGVNSGGSHPMGPAPLMTMLQPTPLAIFQQGRAP